MKKYFPSRRRKVKLSGGDQVPITSTLIRDHQNEEKFKKTFWENQRGFHQQHDKTHLQETDVDDAQWSRSRDGYLRSTKRPSKQRSSDRGGNSELITAYHPSADEKRVVGQTVDMPVFQRVEMNIEVLKITQHVEKTQYQLQTVSRQDPAANRWNKL